MARAALWGRDGVVGWVIVSDRESLARDDPSSSGSGDAFGEIGIFKRCDIGCEIGITKGSALSIGEFVGLDHCVSVLIWIYKGKSDTLECDG